MFHHKDILAAWDNADRAVVIHVYDFDYRFFTEDARKSEYGMSILTARHCPGLNLIRFWIAFYKDRLTVEDKVWLDRYRNTGRTEELSREEFVGRVSWCNSLLGQGHGVSPPDNSAAHILIACEGMAGPAVEQAFLCECESGFWGLHVWSTA